MRWVNEHKNISPRSFEQIVSNPDLMRWVNEQLQFQTLIITYADCQRSKKLFIQDAQGVLPIIQFF